MKRRDAIKGIILFSLGTGIIYSCTDKYNAIQDLKLKHFEPEKVELDLIEMLSRTIIPLDLIPDLADHTALPLIFTMLDDVYEQEDRDAFRDGYQNFDVLIESSEKKKFSEMNEEEQSLVIARLNNEEEEMDEIVQLFFDIVKAESIRYLTTSEYYQRKVNYYEMAPGRYKGSVLINELKNANQI